MSVKFADNSLHETTWLFQANQIIKFARPSELRAQYSPGFQTAPYERSELNSRFIESFRITLNTPEITHCLMINLNCACPTAPKMLVSKKERCFLLKLVNDMADIEEDDSEMLYSSLYGGIDEEANDDKSSNESVNEDNSAEDDAVECLISHRFKPEQNLNLA